MADRRTLLLIGARGFVGRHLAEAAGTAGFEVVRTSRDGAGADLGCDLLDPAGMRAAIDAAAPDAIANLAGAPSVAASFEDPERAFAVNAVGALNLLEAAAATAPEAHLLLVSSAQVYGEAAPERLPFREDSPLQPVTPYGESKAEMERACSERARETGLRIAVVRPFNLVGGGQSPVYSASGFARAIAAAEAGGAGEAEIRVGNRSAARDFLDVRDGTRAMAELLRLEQTGAYNVCSGRPTTIEGLIGMLAELTPLPVRIRAAGELARPNDPPLSYGDPSRLRGATGWEPPGSLRPALEGLLGWWRDSLSRGAGAAH